MVLMDNKEIHGLKNILYLSEKFKELTKNLDIRKMAIIPPIDFSFLQENERKEIMVWAFDDSTKIPEIINTYIEKCK